jgi:recombinational DNA repair ATPase RecF
VLLLDDVFSELDPGRREWLAGSVGDMGQTMITTTSLGDVELGEVDAVFEVDTGQISLR